MFFLSKNHEKSSFHIHQGLEESCIKRLLLGVAFAVNAGSVLLPISSTTTLITLSNWAVRAASASMTLLCACCFLGKWTWSFDFDVSFGFVLFLHFCGGLCLPKLMICIVAWYILSIVQSSCPFCVDRISCRLKLQGLLRDFDHRLSLWSWIFVSGPVALFLSGNFVKLFHPFIFNGFNGFELLPKKI